MSKRPVSHKIRDVVFGILSFILSAVFVLLSVCIVVEVTFFNKTVWFDNMNQSDYFVDKTDEVRKNLIDLGYAGGLDEEFFNEFVDVVMITSDTQVYIDNYFEGSEDIVDTTPFKQSFNEALDEYISEKGIENVNSNNRNYLVNEAARIYRKTLEIPLFTRISVYFQALKKYLPIVIALLFAAAVILILVFVFANTWKHRSAKYIYYALAGAFLSNFAAALFITINGGVRKINLESRALYNFVVHTVNNVNTALWFCTLMFLVLSAALFFVYRALYLKVASRNSG